MKRAKTSKSLPSPHLGVAESPLKMLKGAVTPFPVNDQK